MLRKFKIYHFILISILFWNILILSPVFIHPHLPYVSHFIYSGFHHICHQYDSRSIFLFDIKLAVCSRCWGIYFGFLIGTIAFPLLNKIINKTKKHIFIIALIPILIDIILDFLNIHKSNLLTKSLSGLFFGTLSAIFLVGTLEDALSQIINNIRRRNLCSKNQKNSPQPYTVE